MLGGALWTGCPAGPGTDRLAAGNRTALGKAGVGGVGGGGGAARAEGAGGASVWCLRGGGGRGRNLLCGICAAVGSCCFQVSSNNEAHLLLQVH